MLKQFMVVELPKEDHGDTWLNQPTTTDDYNKAFDCFNEKISTDAGQLFKQPKGTNPLRAVLTDRSIELWVVTRTEELIK